MSASTAATPPVAGRFLLEALAGAGGMGTVYRARDEVTGETVALKLLHPSTDVHHAERFAREAALLSELNHPGIVSCLAYGETETGQPYLAMEWLSGEDLAERLSRGALPIAEALVLLRRAAEALAVAHAQGVVHRDLKPSNLFLRDGQVESVVLLDFGIARRVALSHVMTRTGIVIGTPAYMAPEQARGERDIAPAADVFSLGCVLFECLTGEPPFAADQVMAVLARVLFDEPPRLSRLRPDMPASLDALLGRMLAKQAWDRPRDAAALLAVLDALDPASPPAAPALPSAAVEQELLNVLMTAPPATVPTAPGSPESTIVDDLLAELHRELVALGARLEVLADGSLVATLRHTRGAATDQAAQAAQCALLIKARWPGTAIALGTGRGLVDKRAPAGEVFERAAALLRDHARTTSSDQILLDEVTRGLLEVRFVVHRTPSGAYALTGEELALDASRPLLGKPTPCVGREAELGIVEGVLSSCIEDREPRAVLVRAPPGAGKSRFRHEFLRRLAARGDDLLILIGRGDRMSVGSPYSLLGQALRRLCGAQDGETPEARRDKLASRIGERIPAAARARVVAFVGELCGAAFPDEDDVKLRAARQDPQIMSDQIVQATLDFLRAECAALPTVLVLEDLQWGDALTVKLVDAALHELKSSPLLVLALARPEVDDLFPRLWSGAAHVVPLRPLSKRAGEQLVRQVLGKQVSPEKVARLVEQSEGNALFLEELIHAAAEGRGDEAPRTVLAMLQTRIGRLPSDVRLVLRAASVFGETAWLGGIRALLGETLSADWIERSLGILLKEEILDPWSEGRFAGQQEVRFRHALMRDAAYELLTEEHRVTSHRIAGEYLETCGELDALMLAEHFVRGQVAERAIPYYIQAAEQSYEANDMEAMLSSAERGLGCGAQGEHRGALLSLQITSYLGHERYAETVALSTEALALLPEGSRRWCRVFGHLFAAVTMTRQTALLEGLASHFALVEPSADARGEYVRACSWMASMLGTAGKKEASRAFLERARQVGALVREGDVIAWGQVKVAEASDHHLLEEAPWSVLRCIDEGRAALRAGGEQRVQLIVGSYYGKALQELGDPGGAEADLRQTLSQAERLNEALPLTYARAHLARLLAASAPPDRLDEPVRLAGDVIASKNMTIISMAYAALAEVKWRQRDLAGAEAEAYAACEAVRPFPVYAWECIALRTRILLEQGRAEEALAVGQEGVRELERLGVAGCGEIALRLATTEALHAVGRADRALTALAEIVERLRVRLDDIPEAAARERYLTHVPINARVVALAAERLGLDVRA